MTINHDCRAKQPEHDRISNEIDTWLRDNNHHIQIVPLGATSGVNRSFNGPASDRLPPRIEDL